MQKEKHLALGYSDSQDPEANKKQQWLGRALSKRDKRARKKPHRSCWQSTMPFVFVYVYKADLLGQISKVATYCSSP
jgi:hypothetical protein